MTQCLYTKPLKSDLMAYTPGEKVVFISGEIVKRQNDIIRAILNEDFDTAQRLIELQLVALANVQTIVRH